MSVILDVVEQERPVFRRNVPAFEGDTLDRIIRGLCHEMNNPLGAIRLHLDLVGSMIPATHPESAEIQESLALMDDCVSRLHDIVGAFRKAARGAPGLVLADIDLVDAVASAAARLQARLKKEHIQLEIERSGALPRVRADAKQLQEALEHLVTYSIDALSRCSGKRRIRIFSESDPELQVVRCTVLDTGGATPSGGEIAFDPFYAIRESARGLVSGLGLPIARAICRAHGGDLELRSSREGGMALHFWIPCA